eukprot:6189957-Pleurochrysis_carterae.AAC.1
MSVALRQARSPARAKLACLILVRGAETGCKPSFWTYLKVNGCRGCQKQEERETIHHVLSEGCEGIGRKKNSRYREEMRRALHKIKKLMSDKFNSDGVIQANKAIRALGQPSSQTNPEDETLALRQIISGMIPEWQEVDEKEKKGTIENMKLWTGDMMNWARIHTNHEKWTQKKNEHRAHV